MAHLYKVKAASTMVRSGVVRVEGVEPPIEFSAPPEFRGIAGQWTPEHFLVTAVASCYVSTFSGMADASRLEFLSLDLEAEGTLENDEVGWRFTGISLHPRVKIAHEENRERTFRLLEKAKNGCLIARSLKCSVSVSPEIITEERLRPFEQVGNPVAFVN